MSEKTEDWPRHKSGRYLCTADRPMPKGASGQWVHSDVHEVGDQENGWPGGDVVTNECQGCGVRWRQELPQ